MSDTRLATRPGAEARAAFFGGEEADYLHVTDVILPQLRECGLAEADIDRIMVENPVRWVAG